MFLNCMETSELYKPYPVLILHFDWYWTLFILFPSPDLFVCFFTGYGALPACIFIFLPLFSNLSLCFNHFWSRSLYTFMISFRKISGIQNAAVGLHLISSQKEPITFIFKTLLLAFFISRDNSDLLCCLSNVSMNVPFIFDIIKLTNCLFLLSVNTWNVPSILWHIFAYSE